MWWSVVLVTGLASAAVPDGLRQLHVMAERQSETLDLAESRKKQAEERRSQAVGALFPNLNARYNYQEIDPPPSPRSAFTRINQYSALINLNQPIYRAAAYPAYRYTGEDMKLQAHLVEQAGLTLWSEVIMAYYDAWIARNDLTNVLALKDFSADRVRDLRERVRVGRSRRGEKLQAEAQLSTVEAEVGRAQQAVATADERINFLSGAQTALSFGALPTPFVGTPTVEQLLQTAENRPDVAARAQEVRLYDELISSSRSGHMPSVDFNGNYYLERTGVLKDSKWDVGVAVNIPLYQGGAVNARVKEAAERKREAALVLARLRREIERDIRILWQNSVALDTVLVQLKNAASKSKETYESARRDFGYGLVTNLDVLLTLNQYVDTKRNFDRAVLEKELVALQLGIATGVRP